MKKRILPLIIAILVGTASLITSCGSSKNSGGGKTITLYTGGSDNVRDTWQKEIDAFSKLNTGITVNLQFIPGGQGQVEDKIIAAMQAKQKSIDFDIIDLGDDKLYRVLNEGGPDSLDVLDTTKVPNFNNVLPRSSISADKALPYRGTTVVLAYNSDKVANPPKTADELYKWIKDNPQKFAYNDPATGGSGESFMTTAIYNSLPTEALTSNYAKWAEQWGPGFDLLKDLHPYMYMSSGKVIYPAKNQGTLDLLKDGSIYMTPAWADMVISQKNQGILPENIKLAQIEPSFTGALMNLCIPSIAQNKEAAYTFIDFVVSKEGQEIFVKEMAAIPVIDASTLSEDVVKSLGDFKTEKYRNQTIGELMTKLKEKWQEEIAVLP